MRTVHVHGTKEGSFAKGSPVITEEHWRDGAALDEELLDFEDVAKAIEAHPQYPGGEIRLFCCHSASNGLASRLAIRLSCWILAPTHAPYSMFPLANMEMSPDGNFWIERGQSPSFFFPEDAEEGACWVLYDQDGNEVGRTVHNLALNNALFADMRARMVAQWGEPWDALPTIT